MAQQHGNPTTLCRSWESNPLSRVASPWRTFVRTLWTDWAAASAAKVSRHALETFQSIKSRFSGLKSEIGKCSEFFLSWSFLRRRLIPSLVSAVRLQWRDLKCSLSLSLYLCLSHKLSHTLPFSSFLCMSLSTIILSFKLSHALYLLFVSFSFFFLQLSDTWTVPSLSLSHYVCVLACRKKPLSCLVGYKENSRTFFFNLWQKCRDAAFAFAVKSCDGFLSLFSFSHPFCGNFKCLSLVLYHLEKQEKHLEWITNSTKKMEMCLIMSIRCIFIEI